VLGHDVAVDADDVVVVDWPAAEAERQRLADWGRLRLLRLQPGVPAPLVTDVNEDWFRLPCSDDDIRARMRMLRARHEDSVPRPPRVDEFGVLQAGGLRRPLAPVETRLMRCLLDQPGEVVTRDELAGAGWPDGAPSRNAVDLRVMRLRRRVEPLGVMIRTVRGRGYVVDLDLQRR
jgi:hypothetical protein